MYRVEYDIKLNDSGRPYVHLPDDYEQRPEDRFLALEITRYILQDVYNRKIESFNDDTSDKLDNTIRLLGQIGDEMAEILWNDMKELGDIAFLFEQNYHILVNDIEERDALDMKFIHFNGKIFKRQLGLKVYVVSKLKVYELNQDINNWCEVTN